MAPNLIGVFGVFAILAIAVAFSSNRSAIQFRVVGAALALQALLAALVLYFPWGRVAINRLSDGVLAVIGFSKAGIDMVFGPLADTNIVGFSFAINVLPIIIFFAALMSVLYHLGIMQWLVKIIGGLLHRFIGTGSVESMNAAANIFVGQTEAPLAVKPYLRALSEPQFFTVMVSGVGSVSGSVFAGYAMLGADIEYLLAAAFMAAPGGLLMAKIIMPDDEKILTNRTESLEMESSGHGNIFIAAGAGATDGLRMAVNIAAMLIAFVALIALFNGLVGSVSSLIGLNTLLGVEAVTLELILGKVFQPLMFLLSVPWEEAQAAGVLFGEKLILNEFVAFTHFSDVLAGMSPRTLAVTTVSLCGFANFSSIAVLLGGLGVLVPEKRELIGRFGLRAVLAGSLSNLMSAALTGIMLTS